MTRIIDDSGTRWVEIPQPKRRKSPRALKFGEVQVHDQLKQVWPDYFNGAPRTIYYLVTDRWFDPVAGQDDEVAGQMVGLQQIGPDGETRHSKSATTVRGLASQQYQYAGDYISVARTTAAALKSGEVVGIGKGHVIRRRPKIPGHSL